MTAALAAALALAAAAAGKPTLPPFAHAYEPQSADERGVWQQADEDERRLRDSASVVADPALTAYVRGVLCKAVGAQRCAGARVYVIRAPQFNAYMAPNGLMAVYTGLLLRVRSEAELAAVLGHEFAHFEQRHTLAQARHTRSMLGVMAWMGVAARAGGAIGMTANTIGSSAAGSIFQFSRDQESEADRLGWAYAASSGYDTHCAADVWRRLTDEADATSLGRHQRSRRYGNVAFLADHPTNFERATAMRRLADEAGPGGEAGSAAYAAAIKPWRAQLLADQVKVNDFGGTDYLLGQLAADGWSEDLLFARGELFRARANPRDLVSAAGFYREAIALDPAHAESHRGLGLALLRSGDAAGGAGALRRYLELRPDAPDAAMVATLIPS